MDHVPKDGRMRVLLSKDDEVVGHGLLRVQLSACSARTVPRNPIVDRSRQAHVFSRKAIKINWQRIRSVRLSRYAHALPSRSTCNHAP
jgi:hypothetical protein